MRKWYHFTPYPQKRYVRDRDDIEGGRKTLNMAKIYLAIVIPFILALYVGAWIHSAHADPCNGFMSCGGIPQPTIVTNKEVIWTEEMQKQWDFDEKQIKDWKVKEKQALGKAKGAKNVKDSQKTKKEVLGVIIVKQDDSFSVYALANAVAMAETGGCKKGYGLTHNNCHGIKSGNTAPCPGTPKGAMCKFKTQKESYEAFVKIWDTWYKRMPDLKIAEYWTGKDNAVSWLSNVWHYYGK